MQRHATLAVPLTTAHLGTAETTGALDTDALSAGLAGRLDSLAHSATEGNAALELLGDRLSNEVGVELGALNLDNVDGELALGDASDLLELGAEGIDLGTLLTDDNAGASGEDDDLHLVASALDLDAGDSCAGKTLLEVLADLEIVTEGLSVILLCEPAGAPVLGDAKTEAGGVDFLTHTALRLLSRSNDDGDVGSTLQNARSGTLGAGTDALKRRTLVNIGSGDNQVVGTQTVVVLGVRNGGTENLLDIHGDGAVAEVEDVEGLSDRLAADQIDHQAGLAGGNTHVLSDGANLGGLSFNRLSCHLRLTPYLALWPRNVRVGANSPSL